MCGLAQESLGIEITEFQIYKERIANGRNGQVFKLHEVK